MPTRLISLIVGPTRIGRLARSGLALLMLAIMSLTAACQLSNQLSNSFSNREVTPDERLKAAAERMDDVKTAEFTGRGTVDLALEDGTASLKTDLAAEGELVFPDRQRATINVENPIQTQSKIVRIGSKVWVKNPASNQWVQQSIDDTRFVQPIEPMQAMMLARLASKAFSDLGSENVGGVQTHHIQVELDPNGAKLLLEGADPSMAQHISSVEGTVDLWIGENDLIRQILPDITMHVTGLMMSQDRSVGGSIHTRFAAD